MNTLRVSALIPARSGSKGVPDKNIRPLGNYPLLAWTIAACRKAALIDRVIVSTDSQSYAQTAKTWGAEVPFLRPAELAQDSSPDYEFISHAIRSLAQTGDRPDLVVHMRPTTPLRDPSIIDDAIRAFQRAEGNTALRSVHEMSESAYKSFEITATGLLTRLGQASTSLDQANNPRQSFPKTYIANGYVDVLSVDFIERSGVIHGDKVMPFVTPEAVEVDTSEDFQYLEFLVSRCPTYVTRLFQ